jgi:anaerobic magnesium-protoporphyrin IX monomethyl ester cyclase
MSYGRMLFVFPETRYPAGQPPLGVACLGAFLKRETGVEVSLCDMSFERRPFEALARKIRDFRPDLVGISTMTPQISAAVESCSIARKLAPGAVIAVGGPHATVLPEDTLGRTGADLVFCGEGEAGLGRFVSGEPADSIPGSCFRRGGEIVRVPGLLLVDDLDTLPMPDRGIFDMKKYFRVWYSMDRVDPTLRGTSVMATRGCPFGCTFCQPTLSMIFGRKLRKRSPGNIADEIEALKAGLGISAFMFEDSTFVLDKSWVHSICDELVSRRLGLKWCCNVRADLLDRDLLAHMKAAGLAKINMGVESASQRVLDTIYEKGITVEGVTRSLALAGEMGIMVQGYFMLGAPGETLEEMRETIRFAVESPFDDALFDITTPFPSTELWNRFQHMVNRDFAEFDCFHQCVFDLPGIPPGTVEKLKKSAFRRFYLHRSRILRTLGTVLGPRNLARTLLKARRV